MLVTKGLKLTRYHSKNYKKMKYIRLFQTEADFESNKASLEKPYLCYVDETGEVKYANDPRYVVIMTSESNPSVLAICYAQGWCSSPDKMTEAEAAAVTTIGNAFKASQIGDFTEFKYFTGISSVNGDAFQNSTVTKLHFPDQLTSIGNFRDVSNLRELLLPENLVSIPQYFTIPNACPLLVPKNLETIGLGTVYRNRNFGTIIIDPDNEYLEMIDGVVYNVVSDTIQAQTFNSVSVAVPEGVTTIPLFFQEDNTILRTIELPSSMTTISDRFCRNAIGLKTIICKAVTPPTFTGTQYVLQGVTLTSIQVPSQSMAAYKSAAFWSNYSSIITAIEE